MTKQDLESRHLQELALAMEQAFLAKMEEFQKAGDVTHFSLGKLQTLMAGFSVGMIERFLESYDKGTGEKSLTLEKRQEVYENFMEHLARMMASSLTRKD